MNRHVSLRSGAAALSSLLLASGLAACGSSDNTTATSAAQVTQTATQTVENGSQPAGTTTQAGTPDNPPGQKVVPVNGGSETISSGPLDLKVKVDKLVDPVEPQVDTPQKGNKLVGIILTTKATGKYDLSKTSATAVLNTDDGAHTAIRIIADGICSGAFFPGGVLDTPNKTRTGCVGFEIPKSATPKSISIGAVTQGASGEQATWKLPKAS